MRLKGDQVTTRALNRRMILDFLRREGAVSRRELAKNSGLSGGSVTVLIQELMDEGLISEGEAEKSSGGRKPIPVSINYGARLSIGIKLMERQLEAVLTDLSSKVLKSIVLDLADTHPQTVAEGIAQLVRRLIPFKQDRAEKLIGIGIAMPGFVDVTMGTVLSSHRLGWTNVPIANLVSVRTHSPVWVDNDVNAYAIAQRLFGLARTGSSALVVILGTGIGAALISAGKIHRGGAYRSGEIGFYQPSSMVFPAPSLEELFTLEALSRGWIAQGGSRTLVEALAAQDEGARAYVGARGREIGHHIALLAQLIDPDTIMIGGETVQLGPEYCDAIADAISKGVLHPHGEIVFDHENDQWARGAAVLAIDHFFDFENVRGHFSAGS